MDLAPASLTGSDLIARIQQVLGEFQHASELCINAGRIAINRAILLGALFTEGHRRYPGEYESWLKSNFPKVSTVTAWRFRQCFDQRAKLEQSPAPQDLKSAYVALGLLPPPETKAPDAKPSANPHFYSFRLTLDDKKPITEWPRLELLEFVEQTKPLIELRAQATQLLGLENPS